jgi:hypothetical protein
MATKKPARGRPPKAAGEKHSDAILLKLTPAQRKELERVAKAAGKPLSTWARETLIKVAKKFLD